jgi:hypothetical protein
MLPANWPGCAFRALLARLETDPAMVAIDAEKLRTNDLRSASVALQALITAATVRSVRRPRAPTMAFIPAGIPRAVRREMLAAPAAIEAAKAREVCLAVATLNVDNEALMVLKKTLSVLICPAIEAVDPLIAFCARLEIAPAAVAAPAAICLPVLFSVSAANEPAWLFNALRVCRLTAPAMVASDAASVSWKLRSIEPANDASDAAIDRAVRFDVSPDIDSDPVIPFPVYRLIDTLQADVAAVTSFPALRVTVPAMVDRLADSDRETLFTAVPLIEASAPVIVRAVRFRTSAEFAAFAAVITFPACRAMAALLAVFAAVRTRAVRRLTAPDMVAIDAVSV